MIKVVLMLEIGEVLLEKELEMPFAPIPGMDLMLDMSAWWNQMRFESVMWHADLQEMQCKMLLHDSASVTKDEIVAVLVRNNWTQC